MHARGTERVVRPFNWGLDWLGLRQPSELFDFARQAVESSDSFFAYGPVRDYRLDGERLQFTSPVSSHHPENNVVHGRFIASDRHNGRAVVVLPHWNAQAEQHVGLARLLARCGFSALRLSLPYHDLRMPTGLWRADYAVSSDVGRTLHANRQAVIDVRAAFDWLQQQGYTRLGLVGTSLGSCIAFIVTAHDERVRAAVFNHISTGFADVVWRGLSTSHVRTGLVGSITLDELRRIWAPISPSSYVHKFAAAAQRSRFLRTLFVWARYDLSFPPDLSQELIRLCREIGMPLEEFCLPCGHYTSGMPPFSWWDGARMARFLTRNL